MAQDIKANFEADSSSLTSALSEIKSATEKADEKLSDLNDTVENVTVITGSASEATNKMSDSVDEAGDTASFTDEQFDTLVSTFQDITEQSFEYKSSQESADESTESLGDSVSKLTGSISSLNNALDEATTDSGKLAVAQKATESQMDSTGDSAEEMGDDVEKASLSLAGISASSILASTGLKAAKNSLDEAGDEADDAASDFTQAAGAAELLSLQSSALSINVGLFTIALRNLTTQVPLLVSSLGNLTAAFTGLASAVASVGFGGFAVALGGALAKAENAGANLDDFESVMQSLEPVSQNVQEALVDAFMPVVEAQGSIELFESLLGTLVHTVSDFSTVLANTFEGGMLADSTSEMQSLRATTTQILESVNDNVGDIAAAFGRLTLILGDDITEILDMALEGLPGFLRGVTTATEEVLNIVGDATGGIGKFIHELTQLGRTIAAGIAPVLSSFFGVIGQFVDELVLTQEEIDNFDGSLEEARKAQGAFKRETIATAAKMAALLLAVNRIAAILGSLVGPLTKVTGALIGIGKEAVGSGGALAAFFNTLSRGTSQILGFSQGITKLAAAFEQVLPPIGKSQSNLSQLGEALGKTTISANAYGFALAKADDNQELFTQNRVGRFLSRLTEQFKLATKGITGFATTIESIDYNSAIDFDVASIQDFRDESTLLTDSLDNLGEHAQETFEDTNFSLDIASDINTNIIDEQFEKFGEFDAEIDSKVNFGDLVAPSSDINDRLVKAASDVDLSDSKFKSSISDVSEGLDNAFDTNSDSASLINDVGSSLTEVSDGLDDATSSVSDGDISNFTRLGTSIENISGLSLPANIIRPLKDGVSIAAGEVTTLEDKINSFRDSTSNFSNIGSDLSSVSDGLNDATSSVSDEDISNFTRLGTSIENISGTGLSIPTGVIEELTDGVSISAGEVTTLQEKINSFRDSTSKFSNIGSDLSSISDGLDNKASNISESAVNVGTKLENLRGESISEILPSEGGHESVLEISKVEGDPIKDLMPDKTPILKSTDIIEDDDFVRLDKRLGVDEEGMTRKFNKLKSVSSSASDTMESKSRSAFNTVSSGADKTQQKLDSFGETIADTFGTDVMAGIETSDELTRATNKLDRQLDASDEALQTMSNSLAELKADGDLAEMTTSELENEFENLGVDAKIAQNAVDELGDEFTEVSAKATAANTATSVLSASALSLSTVFAAIGAAVGVLAGAFVVFVGVVGIAGALLAKLGESGKSLKEVFTDLKNAAIEIGKAALPFVTSATDLVLDTFNTIIEIGSELMSVFTDIGVELGLIEESTKSGKGGFEGFLQTVKSVSKEVATLLDDFGNFVRLVGGKLIRKIRGAGKAFVEFLDKIDAKEKLNSASNVLSDISDAVGGIEGAMQTTITIVEAFISGLIKTAFILTAVGVAALFAFGGLSGVLAALTGIVSIIGGIVGGLVSIPALIVGAVAALIVLAEHFGLLDGIINLIMVPINMLIDLTMGLVDIVVGLLSAFVGLLGGVAELIGLVAVGKAIMGIFGGVISVFSGVADTVAVILDFLRIIGTALVNIFVSSIIMAFVGAFNELKAIVSDVGDEINNFLKENGFLDDIKAAQKRLDGLIKAAIKLPSIIDSFFSKLINDLKKDMNKIISILNSTIENVNKIASKTDGVDTIDKVDKFNVSQEAQSSVESANQSGQSAASEVTENNTEASDTKEGASRFGSDAQEASAPGQNGDVTVEEGDTTNIFNQTISADPEDEVQIGRIAEDAMAEANSFKRRQQGSQ